MHVLTDSLNQVALEINETNAQITKLQAKLSELQEFQQQLLSVEQAIQSALGQVDQAVAMLLQVSPQDTETFKNTLLTKFPAAVSGLLKPAPSDPEPAPEPTAPDAPPEHNNDAVVDVQVTPQIQTNEPTDVHVADAPASEATSEPVAESELATQAELEALKIQHIRRLAATKKAGGGGTRAEIAARLAGIVTKEDIWRTA